MIMKRSAPVNLYRAVGFTPPDAVKPRKVGKYPVLAKCGGGMFFDEMLEYRVWVHPHLVDPADRIDPGTEDYYYAFAVYAEALKFARETPGAEEPLVLVRQRAWVVQVEGGHYEGRKSGSRRDDRIAEWQVAWLEKGPRKKGDIEVFLAKHGKVA